MKLLTIPSTAEKSYRAAVAAGDVALDVDVAGTGGVVTGNVSTAAPGGLVLGVLVVGGVDMAPAGALDEPGRGALVVGAARDGEQHPDGAEHRQASNGAGHRRGRGPALHQ